MKAAKVIGILVLIVVVGVIGLVYYGISNLDGLVKTAVERFGSDVTQTAVTLDEVNIDLQEGRAQLSGFVVANPSGYTSDYAFSLSDIIVQIQPSSIGTGTDDVIVINEVTVDGASIIAELQSLRKNNLQDIMGNVQSELPEGAEEPEPAPSEPYSGPNFRVERFVFSNADISVTSAEFGDRTLQMPAVNAADLGGEAGLPPKELAAALMNQVLAQATRTVRSEVEGAAKEEVRSRVQEEVQENLSEEEQEKLQDLRDRLGR